MDASQVRRFVLGALLVLLGVVAGASPSRAKCDPTTDPDKTDIANARAAVAANCNCAGATSHGVYVSCAAQQANLTLTNKSCVGAVKRCAAHSICGKPAGAVTCCVTKAGATKCKIKRDAAHCRAPLNATACVGKYTSCCDACGSAGCAPPPPPTTSTTIPGVCGDGIVNQASEQCDGSGAGCHFSPSISGCFPPGSPDECTCCTNSTLCLAFGTNLQCCDPTATCVFIGPTFGGSCYHPDCGPGHDCSYGRCVGGTCCVDTGAVCSIEIQGGVPCCPPAVCGPGTVGFCCLPAGEACTANAQCCSGSCDPQTATCS